MYKLESREEFVIPLAFANEHYFRYSQNKREDFYGLVVERIVWTIYNFIPYMQLLVPLYQLYIRMFQC